MKTWDLILDPDAIRKYVVPAAAQPWEDEAGPIEQYQRLIRQHRMVWSDDYVELLKKSDAECANQLKLFIGTYGNVSSKLMKIEDKSSKSTNDWLNQAMKDLTIPEWKMVYGPKTKINPPNAEMNCYSIASVLDQVVENKIIRNSTLCNIRIKHGINCKIASEWIKELFENETVISIFDPYVAALNGYKSISQYYAKAMAGKTVYIYTGLRQWNENINELRNKWDSLSREYQIELKFWTSASYSHETIEHDRHIFLGSGVHIFIGKGIDFLNARSRKTDSSNIFISQDKITTPESLQEEFQYKKNLEFPL